MLPLAHLIPEPRQTALRVAFGITAGAPPEPFALAIAALDLLVDAAAEQPLLVVAEDLHWLDPATVGVLRFIARRLEHDPVVLLATTRDDEPDPFQGAAGLLIDLEPLGTDASRGLLASVAPVLSSATRARVLRVAEGNPLALVELPRSPGLTVRAAGSARWLPLTNRLQAAFTARVEQLPPTARAALILLALHDSGSVTELLDALARVRALPATRTGQRGLVMPDNTHRWLSAGNGSEGPEKRRSCNVAESRLICADDRTPPSRRFSSSSTDRLATASLRWPACVSSRRDDRLSCGFGSRRQ